jgi:hypothetical protein
MKKKMLISMIIFGLMKATPIFGYFGDVNLKFGVDVNGLYHMKEMELGLPSADSNILLSALSNFRDPLSPDSKTGVCLGAEVFPFFLPFSKENSKPKLGIGLQYKPSR